MESERIMRKWATRRHWTVATEEQLVYAFIDELGTEALSLFDRYLAKTAAEEDDLTKDGNDH
jgi:hypothetical protein